MICPESCHVDVFIKGIYEPLLLVDANLFSYTRECEEGKLLVAANFYGKEISYRIPEAYQESGEVLIHNYDDMAEGILRPYEAMMIYSHAQ